jgi:acetyl-CoA carboxylase biotin carboxyl carrier protein
MTAFDVDEALVRKLADLLEEMGLTEIEYENGGQRIRVNRAGVSATPVAPPLPAPTAPAPAEPSAPSGPPAGAVTSPMVGTAYLKSDPASAQYVKIGDRVSAGQTLLIIEAMKVMNPIAAPQGGTVMEILVSDAQPVEFGEVLMVIR